MKNFNNNAILLGYIDSDIVTFFSDDTDINTIDLSNTNLNDNDDDGHLETMIYARQQGINACCIASNKTIGLVRARRRKERDRTIFFL